MSPVPMALVLALVGSTAFSCMHALVRHTSEVLHPFEIAFFRSIFGLLALSPLLWRSGWASLRSNAPRLVLLRGLTVGVSLMCWFYGLSIVPIAQATALSFTSIIFASIGAVLVLKEQMGVRRWSAVAVGFIGVILIARPGFGAWQPGIVFILISSVSWGAGLILIKLLSRTDSAITISAWTAISMAVASFFPALTVWEWPAYPTMISLFLIGCIASVGTLCWTQAIKLTDASFIIPVDYTRLVWASLIGYFVFAETVDRLSFFGGLVIVGSTAYIARREAKVRALTEKAPETS